MIKKYFSLFVLLVMSLTSYAQNGNDFLRSTGKIYAVVGVVLALFIGIIIYLINLDKKIKKLENQIHDGN